MKNIPKHAIPKVIKRRKRSLGVNYCGKKAKGRKFLVEKKSISLYDFAGVANIKAAPKTGWAK